MNTTISPRDEMFAGNYDHYFSVGRSAMFNIRCALMLAEAPPPKRILDLPCGHGRVLRAIRAEHPDAEIHACDIETDGVKFCADNFDAVPIASRVECSEIPLSRKYDLIWCGSLLTHLEQDRIPGFLKLFSDHLSDNGVLLFTMHGKRTVEIFRAGNARFLPESLDATFEEMIHEYRNNGFSFHEYPGSPRYGVSLARPSWVIRQLEQLSGLRLLMTHEAGWDHHQDVYACVRTAGCQ